MGVRDGPYALPLCPRPAHLLLTVHEAPCATTPTHTQRQDSRLTVHEAPYEHELPEQLDQLPPHHVRVDALGGAVHGEGIGLGGVWSGGAGRSAGHQRRLELCMWPPRAAEGDTAGLPDAPTLCPQRFCKVAPQCRAVGLSLSLSPVSAAPPRP